MPVSPGAFVYPGAFSGVLWANGRPFSPDGLTFYGCDYQRGLVLAADRNRDTYGTPCTAVVSPSGAADGIAVDEDGCVWVALGARRGLRRWRCGIVDATERSVLHVVGIDSGGHALPAAFNRIGRSRHAIHRSLTAWADAVIGSCGRRTGSRRLASKRRGSPRLNSYYSE